MKHTQNNKMHWVFYVLGFFLTLPTLISAQDIHFSQFFNNPINLNPALTGVFEGDQRYTGAYRSQWYSVPVPYLTFSGTYDQRISIPGFRSGKFGLGLLFNYDRAGDAGLNWMQLGLNLSYTQKLAKTVFLSVGTQLLTGQRAFDPQKLYFDDQFNGDVFDPDLQTTEGFARTSAGYTDISAGINLLVQSPYNRSNVQVGAAYRHLNQPGITFFNDNTLRLPALGTAYVMSDLEISSQIDLQLAAFAQLQQPYREIIARSGVRYHLRSSARQKTSLGLGLGYRLGDALITYGTLDYQDWRFGISYDLNLSPFRVATAYQGGPEITVQYIIRRVASPETYKSCPIF
jgi:type IX secretion system PorP/SprF family membrane protein